MFPTATRIPNRSKAPPGWSKAVKDRVLLLAVNPELTLRQISNMVGVPHATVRSWVSKEKKRQCEEDARALDGNGQADAGAVAPPDDTPSQRSA